MDASTATYAYDGEGRRMKKTYNGETTYYFYGPPGLLCEFISTSNPISTATTASSTDRTLYHTTDKLGSAVLVITSGGSVIEDNRTLPYGEAWLAESTPSTNDKKFTTYQRDAESGLDYAMNRYYGNTTGRFNSPDKAQPILYDPGTLNRYTYVSNDPVNLLDDSGNIQACPQGDGCKAPPPSSPPLGFFNRRWNEHRWAGLQDIPDQVAEAEFYISLWSRAQGKLVDAKDKLLDKVRNGGFGDDCNKTMNALGNFNQ